MNDPADISILIVSYNTRDLIATCLDSIVNVSDSRKEIFVVDNASTDGSVELIRKFYPDVNLIANKENRGFAAANNQALKHSTGRYVFMLNPDAEFLSSSFKPLISYMDSHPQIGLAGIKMINPDGSAQESFSSEYPGQKYAASELSDLKGRLAWVLGASMLVRSDLIKKLGGFDESFFIYGEDQDLCLRIRQMGYEIGYIDSSVLVHLGAQSERQTASIEVWKKKIRAEYNFYQKHYLPQTVRRIARGTLIKAKWRITTLNLLLFVNKNTPSAKDKLIKYHAIHDVLVHEILHQRNSENNR